MRHLLRVDRKYYMLLQIGRTSSHPKIQVLTMFLYLVTDLGLFVCFLADFFI
jgi:hypothetical protein